MAPSSVASSSTPSSPTSERSRFSHQTQGSANTNTPLLPGNHRRLAQAPSVGSHGVEETATLDPPLTPLGVKDAMKGAPHGWPRLAEFMARHPTVQSFDRFHEANMKNLLYYQVEIAAIEAELKRQEGLDWGVTRNMEKGGQYAFFADRMARTEALQWKLVLELRKTLHQYNRAIIEFSQVSAMPEPSKINVQTLFGWLTDKDCGGCHINGHGSNAWGNQNEGLALRSAATLFRELLRSIFVFWRNPPSRTDPRLVVPRLNHGVDGLTGWVADVWMPFWFAFKEACKASWGKQSQDGESGLSAATNPRWQLSAMKAKGDDRFENHSEKSMLRFTSAVATVVACLLPTLAISILTTARGMTQTLLYIGGFTALFAIGLMVLATDTSRVQIFTATAAFSAVLVVFVQNQ